jgi:aminomethyltransferase
MNAYVTDISSSLGCISVQGPRSRDALQKICDADLKQLRFFQFSSTKLAGIPSIVARIGFTGELGFECYFGAEDTVEAWNAIAEAGKEYEILPYGLDVLDTLRYEKGFIFFGYEITEQNNPFECGLDRWIRFEKSVFLGKQSLLSIRTEGPERKLIGLEIESLDGIEQPSDVKYSGKKIGETLLAFYGLTVGKNIAWAFVDSKNAVYGNRVSIASKRREIDATMIDIRCYDPAGKRMKM